MDWKREAADKLRCFEAKQGSIERAGAELRRLEKEAYAIRGAGIDRAPVRGGGNRREDAMINNIMRREELRRAIEDTSCWVSIVAGALEVLSNDERLILDRFYMHRAKGNVEKLCGELHLEKTRVYELREAALRRFTYALYGVLET